LDEVFQIALENSGQSEADAQTARAANVSRPLEQNADSTLTQSTHH
jgi:hypothetical protein